LSNQWLHAATMTAARLLFICFVAAIAVTPAWASPWPRQTGSTFTSLSTEIDRDGNSYSSIYAEYGLAPRNTLGLEAGHSNAGETRALIWLQRALDDGTGANRFSAAVGLGVIRRGGLFYPTGQIVGGWGRGLETSLGDGWLTIEAKLEMSGGMDLQAMMSREATAQETYLTPEYLAKAELTFGLRPDRNWMVINQLRIEDRSDDELSVKYAGSLVREVIGSMKLELGGVLPVRGAGQPAVKIGTWLEF
jgi:hypothetical protein